MAGNEDWSDPFSKMWVHQKSKDNYGVLYIGHSNYQVQFGVNEFGLALDYTAIPKAEGKSVGEKEPLNSDLAVEILSKCKTLKEVLVYLKKYKYQSPFHQMLFFDAEGESLLVNQDGIIQRDGHYQAITNFNSCTKENVEKCERFNIIDESLSKRPSLSISLFKEMLSRTHQEGANPTQYSYILDANTGKLHLYSFHNYENEVVLDYKSVIGKGFMLKDLKSLFPASYAELNFRLHHKDSLKQALINRSYVENTQEVLRSYETAVKAKPETADYPFLLLDIAFTLINEAGIKENNGRPFYYWWFPENYLNHKSNEEQLNRALDILTYLENTPKEDPKQNIGTFEFKGIIYAFLGEEKMAKEYFQKTLEVSPKETGNYQRSIAFLEYLN